MPSKPPKQGRSHKIFQRLGDGLKEIFGTPSPSPSAAGTNQHPHASPLNNASITPVMNQPSLMAPDHLSIVTSLGHPVANPAALVGPQTTSHNPPIILPSPSSLNPDQPSFPVASQLSHVHAPTIPSANLPTSTLGTNQILQSPPSSVPITCSASDPNTSVPIANLPQSPSTTPSTLQTAKDIGYLASVGLRTSLQMLRKSANLLPPLKSAIGILIDCIDIVPVSTPAYVLLRGY
jgi:hypothetical protein